MMDVAPLQKALAAAGKDPGKIDSQWGAKTCAALIAYAAQKPVAGVYLEAARALIPAMNAAGITTRLRIMHFLAQLIHESMGLTHLQESLNYRPDALISTFNKKTIRISPADAARLGRTSEHAADQKGIADFVYGGSWGAKNLGNIDPGDGSKYIGRGFIMITGRANYVRYGEMIGLNLEDHPADAAAIDVAARLAVAYWQDRSLNDEADRDDIAAVTKGVNGGDEGLDQRTAILKREKSVWAA